MLVNLCPCCKMYQTNLTQLMTGNKPKNDPRSWDVVLGVDVLRTPCSAYYSNRSESIFSSRGLLVYFLVALASMTAHIGLQLFWQFKFQLRVRVIYMSGWPVNHVRNHTCTQTITTKVWSYALTVDGRMHASSWGLAYPCFYVYCRSCLLSKCTGQIFELSFLVHE